MSRPRTAVVTGASAGLGRELVRQLVRDRGLTVLATARRRDRLETLAAELPSGRVLLEPGDLADAAFRARLWDRAEAVFPEGLDLLVNNAGIGHYCAFADQDPAIVRQIVEVNLMALIDLTQRAARHMRARGQGQIVQISSVLGFVGMPYSAVYVATKHAVNGLVASLRSELRGTGVRVWAACPGRTQSEFVQVASEGRTGAGTKGEPTERVVRAIVRGIDRQGRSAFCLPTASAWAVVRASQWLPGPVAWLLRHWAEAAFRREQGLAGDKDRESRTAFPEDSSPRTTSAP